MQSTTISGISLHETNNLILEGIKGNIRKSFEEHLDAYYSSIKKDIIEKAVQDVISTLERVDVHQDHRSWSYVLNVGVK